MELRELDINEITDIYNNLLVNDFPKNEVKPLNRIISMNERKINTCYGLYENNEFVGYAFFVKINKSYLLDYFAIAKEQRGKGIGTKALALIKESFEGKVDVILIESENPEYAKNMEEFKVQSNRINFYLKSGCNMTKIKANTFLSEYNILTICDKVENEKELKERYYNIYWTMVDEDTLKKFVKIH